MTVPELPPRTLPETGRVFARGFTGDGQTLLAANASGDLSFWHGGP